MNVCARRDAWPGYGPAPFSARTRAIARSMIYKCTAGIPVRTPRFRISLCREVDVLLMASFLTAIFISAGCKALRQRVQIWCTVLIQDLRHDPICQARQSSWTRVDIDVNRRHPNTPRLEPSTVISGCESLAYVARAFPEFSGRACTILTTTNALSSTRNLPHVLCPLRSQRE